MSCSRTSIDDQYHQWIIHSKTGVSNLRSRHLGQILWLAWVLMYRVWQRPTSPAQHGCTQPHKRDTWKNPCLSINLKVQTLVFFSVFGLHSEGSFLTVLLHLTCCLYNYYRLLLSFWISNPVIFGCLMDHSTKSGLKELKRTEGNGKMLVQGTLSKIP